MAAAAELIHAAFRASRCPPGRPPRAAPRMVASGRLTHPPYPPSACCGAELCGGPAVLWCASCGHGVHASCLDLTSATTRTAPAVGRRGREDGSPSERRPTR